MPDATNDYKLKISPETDEKWMKPFTDACKERSPQQMSFLSIGGRPEIPQPANSLLDTFSTMASTKEDRRSFISSSINVARKYGFDGLDLDWEFPNNQTDMENLALLFREWREAIEENSRVTTKSPLLLSAAVYFAPKFFLDTTPRCYPIEAINKYVDFVGPRCFDYHGSWDTTVTAAHACLYDTGKNHQLNTSYGISSWISAGLNPRKLVMGLPLYGRTWKLRDPNDYGIGAPAIGTGPGDHGVMTYNDIVIHNTSENVRHFYDESTVSTYSYSGTDWIGYDETQSIQGKVKFAKDQHLGGYFFWALQYGHFGKLASAASNAWDGE